MLIIAKVGGSTVRVRFCVGYGSMNSRKGNETLTRKKVFLITQSVFCALIAGLLAAAALSLYFDGAAKQAQGDLFYYMFTREKVGAKLLPILPLFFCALGLTLSGLILGVADEKAEKPVRDEKLLRDLGRQPGSFRGALKRSRNS